MPGNPIRMSDMDHKERYAAVPLGYNTVEVLSEVVDEKKVHEIMDPVLKQAEEKGRELYANA